MLELRSILIKKAEIRSKTGIKMSKTYYLFAQNIQTDSPESLFDPVFWQTQQLVLGSAKGRGITYFLKTKDRWGINCALRHYYRGGLFGKLVKDHFLFSGINQCRSIKEFNLLQQLKQKNLPVPKPIAARVIRSGCCYQADILSELIENSQDLVAALQKHSLHHEIWYHIGKLIRQLHNEQVCHSDLNAHNILLQRLENHQCKLWLLDFDKCGFKTGDNWKQENLQRLYRSFQKEVKRYHIHFNENNWQQLLSGYTE
ncbi:3-deoxy-D-manno-octulosonic acid kinase [Gallibacterium anatis]|uniref:3-deoxy-D-manno-octulosonic acid kinase n=3 Tax=Gallibacterium TaxID=155493 RepID=U1IAJ9_9PAST|nr:MULTISPECIES: 3-deoxy-D-manno-octulosonic acid kinase [Gallibacterium]ERF79344.1 3-deoxy-D-manno-octulosonic acid kinase [Gallibacterium anatis 12656/12]KGQ37434.1 3-deoxy-D-manno-octulosonic acid kinase [Gallibacterium genomosp. 1]KGQ49130.1 3-deoxy-D-manno-octulosonic acid kinase [Gallibacterium anatis]